MMRDYFFFDQNSIIIFSSEGSPMLVYLSSWKIHVECVSKTSLKQFSYYRVGFRKVDHQDGLNHRKNALSNRTLIILILQLAELMVDGIFLIGVICVSLSKS